ncbi:MAG: hypothetical protein HY079_01765 [Elusimicrobia bacterium]|nr:hypothetical protein [Elusimicrobiota bacterium]
MIPARGKTAVVFLLGLVLGAAAGSWGQRAMMRRFLHRGPDPKRMVERLSRALSLDDAQKTAVAGILDSRRGDFEAVKKDTFSRLEALRASADAEIEKVLRPDQAARFAELRRRRRPRFGPGPEDGPPPPPEPR